MNIVLLGPPGSGKGTQAERLERSLGLTHVSTGDLFRHHLSAETALGDTARSYMERGELVPDEVTVSMVSERLKQDDRARTDGALFDGFPRTIAQAEALEALLASHGGRIDAVVALSVADNVLLERLLARGRTDDKPETVHVRLAVYRRETEPLIDFYEQRGTLLEIDGVGYIDDITERIIDALASRPIAVGRGGEYAPGE